MATPVSLGALEGPALVAMSSSEDKLSSLLSSISSGTTVTAVDLLTYQAALGENQLTGELTTTIISERKKTLEDMAQKM
jgi:hypothetical protein